jgi:hypothetical protein
MVPVIDFEMLHYFGSDIRRDAMAVVDNLVDCADIDFRILCEGFEVKIFFNNEL